MRGLSDRTFIVTGGSSGIGRGTCEHLANAGARVAIVDVASEAANRVANELQSKGASAHAFACDVAIEASVSAMVESVVSSMGTPHGVVNCAGVNIEDDRKPVEASSTTAFERVIAVNLLGTFLVAKHTMPHLLEGGGGSIVNVASTAGIRGGQGQGLGYVASKGGVVAFSQHLASVYGKRGIRVNCLCPGATAGEGMGSFFRRPEGEAAVSGFIPMGRVGQAEEAGAVAAFLLCDDASYITGQTLAVDGGATAR